MMQRTWLLLDMNYLAHYFYYALGNALSHEGEATSVAYGILREIDTLTELFQPERFVCSFDDTSQINLRVLYDEKYKANRREKELTDEERFSKKLLHEQLMKIGKEILPESGYKNIFRVKGFEGDDILAEVALNKLPEDVEAIIVSNDNDMWQCLRPNVMCYSPPAKKIISEKTFREEWGIDPQMWPHVKAYAGDTGDNVIGLPGIGLKTAVKWFNGTLNPKTKTYKTIEEGRAVHDHNFPLVSLPFAGCRVPEIVPDEVDETKRMQVATKLGIRSTRRPRETKESRQAAFE